MVLSAERDGEPVASPPADLGPLDELAVNSEISILLWEGIESYGDNAAHYALEIEIEPSVEAQAYIDEVSRKRSHIARCGGYPLVPAKPGVYVFSSWHGIVDATIQRPVVTIAADRETVTLDFLQGDEAWTVIFEVEDVGFNGCVCSAGDSNRPAIPTLALFALLARLRRRPTRAGGDRP